MTVPDTPIQRLRAALPGLALQTDGLELYATDVCFRGSAPLAVASPRDEVQVQALVAFARDHRLRLAVRGGGLSYSGGYLDPEGGALLVDLSGMTRILELNPTDNFVTVEPGVTWEQLDRALRAVGRTTPFRGTLSGRHATVGGAVSQGAKLFGSASRGGSAESVLALRVVTGRAEVVQTGSAAGPEATPFFRNYGPDLTGMFLGDCGAFGIKTAITLQLIPAPAAEGYASFSFADPAAQMRAMAQIGSERIASECLGLDPFTARARMAGAGLLDDLGTLRRIVGGSRSLLSGLASAGRIALSGRRFASGTGYLMNAVVEGRDGADMRSRLARLNRIAIDHGGRPLPDSIPRAMRADPFPAMDSLLTPSGKRNAWLHVVVPNSRGAECLLITEEIYARNAERMKQHGIGYGYLLSTHGPSGVGVETLLRWPDEILPIHLLHVPENRRAAIPRHPDNPEGRRVLNEISGQIIEAWTQLGGVHLQIGKKYPYLQTRTPEVRALLNDLKARFDPEDILGSGNLFGEGVKL